MRLISLFGMLLMLSGCSTFTPLPENYNGPTAKIKDSYSNRQATKAHYFTLDKIDGNDVANSFGETRSANYGRGAAFDPVISEREVLPKMQTFTISGYVFFPTDVQLLFGDTLSVTGDIHFSPEEGESYVVTGRVGDGRSEVWLEDSAGNVVLKKFSTKHD
ncbi:MAG: hypothetical protein P1U54_14130 [Immundisolibacteraceae bacterium]|nr:hypothetical protein [Immundisolibacteraceae bacterium]